MLVGDQDEVEQPVGGIRRRRERELRPDLANVHRLDADELAGQIGAVEVELPSSGPYDRERIAEQFEPVPHLVLRLVLLIGGPEELGEQTGAGRLDELRPAPRRARLADVERAQHEVRPRRDQLPGRRAGETERAGDVVRRAEWDHGHGSRASRQLLEYPVDRSVAAGDGKQVRLRAQRVDPPVFLRRSVVDLVADEREARDEGVAIVILAAGAGIVDQQNVQGPDLTRGRTQSKCASWSRTTTASTAPASRRSHTSRASSARSASSRPTSSSPRQVTRSPPRARCATGAPTSSTGSRHIASTALRPIASRSASISGITWTSSSRGSTSARTSGTRPGTRGRSRPPSKPCCSGYAVSRSVRRSTRRRVMGRELFWFTVAPIERPAEGTDLWAFQNGYVTLTPLGLDLTSRDELAW